MAQRKIAGARAIVTGASSGIGREIARELARHGARVIVTGRREERLRDLAAQIRATGGEVHIVAGDITDHTHRVHVLQTAQHELNGLDILVNNAGITGLGPFLEADASRLRSIMEVNFFAPVEMIRAAAPLLWSGTDPIIVNICSVLGHRAVPKKSEYCASKFALHGFSDALRCELAPLGIDVLLVSPSTTESEIFDAPGEGAMKSQAPLRILGAMSSEAVARKTVWAIRRGRHEVILSPGGKLLVWLDRLCPPLMNWLVTRFG